MRNTAEIMLILTAMSFRLTDAGRNIPGNKYNKKRTNLKNKGDIFVRVVPIEELQAATVAFIPEKEVKFQKRIKLIFKGLAATFRSFCYLLFLYH